MNDDDDVMLVKFVDQEIAEARGKWKWFMKFSIFWPWIWPQGKPFLQLRTVTTFCWS